MGTCCDVLTSIEFSFDPCNIYRDGPRGVGYPADARSVGDSHPSCSIWFRARFLVKVMFLVFVLYYLRRIKSDSIRYDNQCSYVYSKPIVPVQSTAQVETEK